MAYNMKRFENSLNFLFYSSTQVVTQAQAKGGFPCLLKLSNA